MNQTATQRILERVRKLTQLAESEKMLGNVEAAASVFAQAQKLMSEHAITESMLAFDVDSTAPQESYIDDLLHRHGKRIQTWKAQLAIHLCKYNQCHSYIERHTGSINIAGKPSNQEKVRYLFAYITKEIDRLCNEFMSISGGYSVADLGRSNGKTVANNFRHGAVHAIAEALRFADKQARFKMQGEANSTDIVLVNDAIARIDAEREDVAEWIRKQLGLVQRHAPKVRGNREAFLAGAEAGKSINLGSGPSLGAGNRVTIGRGQVMRLGSGE